MRVELQLQHKLHHALGSIKDHATVGMALINNRDAFHRHIEVAVVRATSHDGAATVDDKHIHQILFLVSNDPKLALFLAHRLSGRLHKTRDPLVALKTLVLVHRLLRGGNSWFESRLRRAHFSGHLNIHLNNNNTTLFPHFLHSYASYLEKRMEWAINPAGKLEPPAPAISTNQVLDYPNSIINRIIKGQELLDRALLLRSDHLSSDCDPLLLTLKESFEVYRGVWEGITFIASEFFDLTGDCRAMTIDVLKKASEQNREISSFYGDCKRIIGRKQLDYPCVNVVTIDHIAAMEQLRFDPGHKVACKQSNNGGFGSLSSSSSSSSAAAPFSLTNETKISKVWVVFDDQEEPH